MKQKALELLDTRLKACVHGYTYYSLTYNQALSRGYGSIDSYLDLGLIDKKDSLALYRKHERNMMGVKRDEE